MDVSSIQSSTATLATNAVTTLVPPTDGSVSSSEPAVSTSFSKMGDLMKQLQSLETSDPDKAKAVMTSIASQLTDKANATGDSRMKALADKFTQAAQTGDVSSLQPQGGAQGAQGAQGGHHGGHHHHHGGGGGGGSDASKAQTYTSTDPNPMEDVESIMASALAAT